MEDKQTIEHIVGSDVTKISAPQNRKELVFSVFNKNLELEPKFHTLNLRFYNSTGGEIDINFSHLDINLLYDNDTKTTSLGELEEINRIDNGFEVVGDFGIIWIYCDSISPPLNRNSLRAL